MEKFILLLCVRHLADCVSLKTKSRKDAKDRKEKNTTLYLGYYLVTDGTKKTADY